MGKLDLLSGNKAVAYGAKLSRVQVVSAYPITPQTTIVEKIAAFVANGEMDTKYIKVESEHSAMAACIAASNTGARAFTATSSHGLLLMHELLIWASGARLPVVMSNVCRANGPPWSVWADHHDAIAQRDTGWIQFYAESNQEVLDTIIQAYKVAENKKVSIPAMVMEDAFILSHTYEPVEVYDQEVVDDFLPPYEPEYKLDPETPYGFGSLVMPDLYMEFRYKIARAMDNARKVIKDVGKEFGEIFGRRYELVEFYRCEDADVALIMMGSIASTAKEVVDDMRKEGKNVGLARLRVFRPFPYEEIRWLAQRVNMIGVVDRSYTFGFGGAVFNEVRSSLYATRTHPIIKNYIAGLGGRDITPVVIRKIFEDALNVGEKGLDMEIEWVGLRGGRL